VRKYNLTKGVSDGIDRGMKETNTNTELAPVKVGQQITSACGTDRRCYEVISVVSRCKIIAREMKAIRLHKGMTVCQDWKLESDPEGRQLVLTYRTRNGRWGVAGSSTEWWNGITIHPVGETANYYYDYSF